MKKITSIISLLLIAAVAAFAMTSCEVEPEYDTMTQNAGNYCYSLGEQVDIIDIETRETIATLTITSCELIEDEPFSTILEDGYDSDEEPVYKETVYTALYKLNIDLQDNKQTISDLTDHFDSDDSNFVINPTYKPGSEEYIYVGAKRGNDCDDVMSLKFVYDTNQSRHTAKFDITIEELVEDSNKTPVIAYACEGYSDDSAVMKVSGYESQKTVRTESSDDSIFNSILGTFGTIAVIITILSFLIGVILPLFGFIGFIVAVRASKKIKACNAKISDLETRLTVMEKLLDYKNHISENNESASSDKEIDTQEQSSKNETTEITEENNDVPKSE